MPQTGVGLPAPVTGNLLGRIGDRLQTAAGAKAGAGGGAALGGGEDGLTRMFRCDMIIAARGAIATPGGSAIAALKGEAE